jgi:hypothetical protein
MWYACQDSEGMFKTLLRSFGFVQALVGSAGVPTVGNVLPQAAKVSCQMLYTGLHQFVLGTPPITGAACGCNPAASARSLHLLQSRAGFHLLRHVSTCGTAYSDVV